VPGGFILSLQLIFDERCPIPKTAYLGDVTMERNYE
jgi:hypothetical protein